MGVPIHNKASPAKRRKWPVAYFLLGTFNVLSLAGSYTLSAEMMQIQERSARINREWAADRSMLSDYRRLGRDINDDAKAASDMDNRADLRADIRRALAEFSGYARTMRKGVTANGTPTDASLLLAKIEPVEASIRDMADGAEDTVRLYDAGQKAEARLRASVVNTERSALTTHIGALAETIEDVQRTSFRKQAEAMDALRTIQLAAGFVIFAMIAATIAYGVNDVRKLRKHVAELESTTKALRASEAKLRNIFKMAPKGILATDERGRITMFSDGAEVIFGYKAHGVLGRDLGCLMPARFRTGHQAHFQSFTGNPHASRKMGSGFEIVGLHKNGTEFLMEASLSKIEMPDGMICTAIMRDLTRAKAMYDDLQEAKQRAEEASKAKSTFIANMSHELRTPLNAILGFSELLQSDFFSSKRAEYSNLIHDSGRHLLNLINDILDLSKVEAGRWTLRDTHIEMGRLISDSMTLMIGNAETAGVALTSNMPKNLPAIYGDERALTQILLNLISNAIKYTRAGGEVTVFARLDQSGEMVFGVRDTGIGISEEDQKLVFDQFGQGRHDTVRADKGTGLGLPIVKGLAIAHGGRVQLESKVGAGTCVTVFLPSNRVQPIMAQRVA
jgi:PAS domain S-box-containing protein